MSGRVLRRALLALIAVLTSALVAGCVTLPDHSGVNQGRSVRARGGDRLIKYVPPPPRPGATKSEIVTGYLQAMLAFPQSPGLVRRFLTPEATKIWEPEQLLVVYQDPQITSGRSGTIAVTAQKLGSLDTRGSWTSAAPSDELSIDLWLQKVDGQWRISNPPAGTLLDTDYFQRYYHQFSLFFFDPTHTVLAPDPVFQLLGRSSRMATDLVRNLLLGPTAAMHGVVSGVVPADTRLDPQVTVTAAGLALVRLTRQVAGLSPRDLELFAGQLSWTLRQSRLAINHIRIVVGDRVVVIPGLRASFPAENTFSSFNPSGFPAPDNLYALADGVVSAVTPTGPSAGIYPVPGPIGNLDAKGESMAVSIDATRAAVVVADRTRVVVGPLMAGTKQPVNAVWFRDGTHLLKPSWDSRGMLWLVDRTAHGAVVRVVTSHQARVVDAPGIAGQDVRAFAVSRDGMRFAAVIDEGSDARLVTAMVRRSATSRLDVSLVGVRQISNAAFPFVNLSNLVWFSPTSVAVLAEIAGNEPQPYQIAIDGSEVQPTTGFLPVSPVSLTAGGSASVPPVIGTEDGRLYIRGPNQQWVLVPTKARVRLTAPTYPG